MTGKGIKADRTYRKNEYGERVYRIQMEKIDPSGKGEIPARAYPGDAGYDLAASELIAIDPGEFRDVPTNIRICLPPGIWGRITGRSSTLRNRSLLVNEGIIDNGFRGELKVGVFNLGKYGEIVSPGERLAQIILADVVAASWVWSEGLPTSERAERGFGSTGV